MKIVETLLLPAIFLVAGFCHSQNKVDFTKVLDAFEKGSYHKVNRQLHLIDTSTVSLFDKATWLYYNADYQFKIDRHDLAYKAIRNSKDLFVSLNKISDAIDCNILMLKILSHQNDLEINTDDIIEETEIYALKNNDSIKLREIYHRIASNYLDEKSPNQKEAIKYFRKIIPIALALKDSIREGYSFLNIGTTHQNAPPENIDSAVYYTRKALKIIKKHKNYQSLAYAYNNYAEQQKIQKKYDSAIYYYSKADSIPLKDNISKSKLVFYENMASAFDSINDYENQAKYLSKYKILSKKINEIDQNIAIEQFDNESLRADNLESETKRKELELNQKKNQVKLIGLIVLVFFVSSISFILLKSSRRKRLLALQEKELETQKNLTLLKEQEITSINAMVEGQEKERKRVAEDLHDNLGSVIATLKLHFENLRINREKKKIDQEVLFDKTEDLIDEAYLKVRSIAHAKNAGVIANQGLLVAVQVMAEKISSAKTLQIEVIDFGLEKRLDNSLELSLFRIIQELVTNIIKHAEADKATINISQYEGNINIILEDDGKGMDVSQIDSQKGMGLDSIQTRVEHLKGNFAIDSTPTKGTTVIINVPL
ncbi:MAG: hypothetical protein JXR05_11695 [Flavobacteriaceae bacterium]